MHPGGLQRYSCGPKPTRGVAVCPSILNGVARARVGKCSKPSWGSRNLAHHHPGGIGHRIPDSGCILTDAVENVSDGFKEMRKFAKRVGSRMLETQRPSMGYLALVMPSLPGGGWGDLWKNRIFVAGIAAWFLAQFAKIFTKRYKKGVWDLMAFRDSGGMPSSHSAMSMAVTTAIALDCGLAHPMFAVALCFTSIVMYDAAGVRKHAGYQAQVLNSLVEHAGLPDTHPFSARKLKEVLGHTPRQVVVGGMLGILVGMFMPVAA